MKKQLLIGMGGLLVIGGLLAACSAGCRQADLKPNPDKTATTTKTITTKLSQTSPTTSETISQTTTTTKINPTGYVDRVGSEEWPYRDFNSIEGFIHWIENPNFKVEENPFEPEKDEHGYDVYKSSYFEALYPDHQQMFAVDRFYMLPDVPSDWKCTYTYIIASQVGFTYSDNQNNKYHYSYSFYKPGLFDIENSEFFAFKKTFNDQEYYVIDYSLSTVAEKKGRRIKTLVNGYLCEFKEETYNPDKKDSVTKGYEDVIYSKDTDLTNVVSKIKFKRIDLPPLKDAP